MAAATTNETYDALWTLTMRSKRKRLTDNISDSYPTIGEFRKSGLIETETGGKQIQEDLMYALQGGQWFDTYDVLATDRIDGITAAWHRLDAIAATALSPTRPDGPKQLKMERKTTHDLV